MHPAIPLKQVIKFFILESSRKSCRQKGQTVDSESGQESLEPSAVFAVLASSVGCVRGYGRAPSCFPRPRKVTSAAASSHPHFKAGLTASASLRLWDWRWARLVWSSGPGLRGWRRGFRLPAWALESGSPARGAPLPGCRPQNFPTGAQRPQRLLLRQAHLALVIHVVEILPGSGFRALALCVGDTFVPTAGPSSP